MGAPGHFCPYNSLPQGNIRADDACEKADEDYSMILAATTEEDALPNEKFVRDVLHVEPSAKWFNVLFISLNIVHFAVRNDHSVVVEYICHHNNNYLNKNHTMAELLDRGFQIWTPLTPDAGIYDALNRRYVAP